MKKRVAAVLLSVAMIMSFLPAMAFATDGSQDAQVQNEAVTDAPETAEGSTDLNDEEAAKSEESDTEESSEVTEASTDEEANVDEVSDADAVCKIGNTNYASINAAITAVAYSTDKTIVMLKDVTLDLNLYFDHQKSDQSCTIDLNGHTIRRDGGWVLLYTDANTSLTINDSSKGNGKVLLNGDSNNPNTTAIYSKGPLTINGGTIECTNGYAIRRVYSTVTINRGATIKGAAGKSISTNSNKKTDFVINGGHFSDANGNGNYFKRLANMNLAQVGSDAGAYYALQLPAPTNLAWGSRYPHYATYEWDHKNLEEYLDKFHVTATCVKGGTSYTQRVNADYYYADFYSFMNNYEDGKYSFSVTACPTGDSDYAESETVTLDPVQFYKLNLTVGNAGGSVLLRRGDGAERIDDSRKWIYPTGSDITFEAVPDVGYLFGGYTKNETESSADKELSFKLNGNTNVVATFTKSNDKSTVEVKFGNSHATLCTNVATAINSYSGGNNSRWPYDKYGQISASVVDNTKLQISFPQASAHEFDVYDYVNDVLMEYLEDNSSGGSNPYIDQGEALAAMPRAIGKNDISQYKSEDDVEKEWNAAEKTELGATLSLNVLWARKATIGKFTVENPLCKSKIEKVRNEDSEYGYTYYTQTNPPEVSVNEGSHFELYGGQNPEGSAAYWYKEKDIPATWRLDDYWYEGTVEAGKKYIAGLLIAPKFGYYVEDTADLTFTVNGERVPSPNLNSMPLLLADVEAVHDWMFTGFTWTGNGDDGYTAATADYMCKQCSTRESKPATLSHTGSSYTASITAENSLDKKAHSETKGVTQKVTITFYSDSEGTTILDQYRIDAGSIIGIPSKLPSEREGATFAGWSSEPGKTAYAKKNNTKYNYVVDASTTEATADTKLYPIYVPDRLQVKLVPGKNVTMPKGSDGKDQALEFITDLDEKIRMEAMNAATREGYVLDGWYTANGVRWNENWGMSPEYCDKNSDGVLIKTFNKDRRFYYYTMTLKARWKSGDTPAVINYALGAHSSGKAPASVTVKYGDQLTLPEATAAENGYRFAAWRGRTEAEMFGAGETLKSDTWEKLVTDGKAVFTATYEKTPAMGVIFDTDGGSYVPTVSVKSASEKVYAPDDPTKTGYNFVKWVYVDANGTEGTEVKFPITVDGLVTVKAQWTKKTTRITFDTHGGTKIPAIEANYGANITWPADPVMANYKFAGWSAGPFTTMPPDDMVIDALWDTTETTITLDANGGKFSDTSSKKKITDIYGAKIYAETPTRNGYTFVGWKGADGKGLPEYMPEEDATYTAQWIEGENANTLMLKAVAKGKKSLKLSWTNVAVADGYDVFFGRCKKHGKKYVTKYVGSVNAGEELTFTAKNLKKGRNYKAYVKAWIMRDGVKQYITTSPTVHAIAGGSNALFTNPKRVAVKKKAVTLSVGKTSKIRASVIKLRKGKRLISKSHAPKLRYMSTNTAVATVTSKGKIKAVGSGTCTVYAYAANGVWKTIKVTVN